MRGNPQPCLGGGGGETLYTIYMNFARFSPLFIVLVTFLFVVPSAHAQFGFLNLWQNTDGTSHIKANLLTEGGSNIQTSVPSHGTFGGTTVVYATTLSNLTYTYTAEDAGRPGAGKDIGLRQSLDAPGISIQYGVAVYELDSNGAKIQKLTDGAIVPAGTRVLYEFKPHEYTDVAWYGTGGLSDTPYGLWSAGAVFPPSAPFCIAANTYPGNRVLFAVFAVDPPIKNIGFTGAQTECSLSGDGVSQVCTVSDPGEISTTFTFDATFGHFFAGYNHGGNYQNEYKDTYGCESRGRNPMTLSGQSGPPYLHEVSIPTQTIPFTLTVAPSAGGPPTIPTLTSIGQCVVGQAQVISMTSTDPDSDMLRYGIDWDADGSIDQYVPSSGYVPSGTSQIVSRTYSVVGAKTVKVLAQDSNGLSSGWATANFSCADIALPPTVAQCSDGKDNDGDGLVDSQDPDCAASGGISEFTAVPPGSTLPPGIPTADLRLSVPSLVGRGKTVQVVWSADYVTSCLPVSGTNGDSFAQLSLGISFFSRIGGRTSSPITAQTTYSLICTDLNGVPRSKTATVNIQPNFRER